MAAIISGVKETYAEGHLPKNLSCIECGAPVHQEVCGRPVVISGGFHCGFPDIFLCADCARNSDLHKLGYLIGDAIFSDYKPSWELLQNKVKEVINRLEKSVLRAIVYQFQYRLRQNVAVKQG
jgi:hypothetical protein